MKGNWLNSKAAMVGVGVIVAGVVLYVITQKLGKAAAEAVDNFNKDTPYEGSGVVGAVGNVTNKVSGGVLGSIGDWLGSAIFDATHEEYDPNAPVTYIPRKLDVRQQAKVYAP